MKNQITGNGNTEIPDFDKPLENPWANGVTLLVALAHFKWLRGHLEWMETEGKKLFEDVPVWSLEQFGSVADHLLRLISLAPRGESFCFLFKSIIQKGTASLGELASNLDDETAWKYFVAVSEGLDPNAHCGLNSRSCTHQETDEMIRELAVVAQKFRSERMLELLSFNRYPGRGNELSREMFMKHFKNW